MVAVVVVTAALVGGGAGTSDEAGAAQAACASTTVVIMAHPDDALAFMHDNVRWQAQLGNCVHLVSLTSYYDTGGPTPDRENGSRDAYQLLTDANAPDDTPQTYSTAVQQSFGPMTTYRMFIHNSASLTLSFYRLPASTYSGHTPGTIYDLRNDPDLIASLAALLNSYQPSKVYTLDTAGLLDHNGIDCAVQDDGMIHANECDHFDHVGSAIVTRQAVIASGITTTVHEFRGYAMGAGKPVSYRENCGNFCAMLDAYLAEDTAAESTPWGPFLTTADQPVRSYGAPLGNAFTNRRIRTGLSSTGCVGPQNGSSADGTRIVVLASCTGAATFTLTGSGELRTSNKCVEAGPGATSAQVFITTCTSAPHQRWSYNSSAGTFTLQHSGLRLDLDNSYPASGAILITFPATGNTNQVWQLL